MQLLHTTPGHLAMDAAVRNTRSSQSPPIVKRHGRPHRIMGQRRLRQPPCTCPASCQPLLERRSKDGLDWRIRCAPRGSSVSLPTAGAKWPRLRPAMLASALNIFSQATQRQLVGQRSINVSKPSSSNAPQRGHSSRSVVNSLVCNSLCTGQSGAHDLGQHPYQAAAGRLVGRRSTRCWRRRSAKWFAGCVENSGLHKTSSHWALVSIGPTTASLSEARDNHLSVCCSESLPASASPVRSSSCALNGL